LEETEEETIGRARRLRLDLDCMRLYPNTCESNLFDVIKKYNPSMAILDSIGKAASNPADEVNVAKILKKDVAMVHKCPVLIISHVTKDQAIAGMNDLVHEVDAVMTFFPTRERKGPRDEPPRELETTKNRRAPTGCVTYSMVQSGLIERPEGWTEGAGEETEEEEIDEKDGA
jgi:predicted ATP-dependent serine protease